MSASKVSDRILMAYVDGELDAEGVAAVEQAMREEPAVASAIAAQLALRERLRRTYAPILDEPVPERLLRWVDRAATAPVADTVMPLRASRNAAVARCPRWRWPEWTALAASIALGVLVSPWLRPEEPPALLEMSDRGLLAGAGLAQALDNRLTSDGAGQQRVSIGLSFRAQDGHYCRTFVVDEPRAVAGLACREADGWRVTALGESTLAGGELRLASSPLPPSILAEVDARLAGDPLDAAGERAAREAGWR